jgi:hypothetical protein
MPGELGQMPVRRPFFFKWMGGGLGLAWALKVIGTKYKKQLMVIFDSKP